MDQASIRKLLDQSVRYVAFVDILGYRSIVSCPLEDERRFKRLYSLFETLGVAFFDAVADFNKDLAPADSGHIQAVSFSDSLYLSARQLSALLCFLEGIFATAYGFQEHTYDDDEDNWVPLIRAGVSHGWVVNFRDVSMRPLSDSGEFRNPVGPAVANAYVLTEETGRLPGMRCFMERKTLHGVAVTRVEQPAHYQLRTSTRTLRLLDVPDGESKTPGLDLVELAWPSRVVDGNNCTFYKALASVRRQFEGSEARRHYNGTVDLFQRTMQVIPDEVAKQVWNDHAGRARLLLSMDASKQAKRRLTAQCTGRGRKAPRR